MVYTENTTLSNGIASLGATLAVQNVTLSAALASIAALASSLAALQTSKIADEGAISSLSSTVVALLASRATDESSIAALRASVAALQQSVTVLHAGMAADEGTLVTLGAGINSLQSSENNLPGASPVDSRVNFYPPAAMTGSSTTLRGVTYTASSSTTFYSADAIPQLSWNAFDKTTNTWWSSATDYSTATTLYTGSATLGGFVGDWLQLHMSTSLHPVGYSLQARIDLAGDIGYVEGPTQFVVIGSSNRVSWTLLDNRTTSWTAGQVQYFVVASTASYFSYFALVVQASNTVYPVTAVAEMQLFGALAPAAGRRL